MDFITTSNSSLHLMLSIINENEEQEPEVSIVNQEEPEGGRRQKEDVSVMKKEKIVVKGETAVRGKTVEGAEGEGSSKDVNIRDNINRDNNDSYTFN